MDIYIRPIREEDALISYKWRNDDRIWRYTHRRPNKRITKKIESDWLRDALQKKDEMRFAICLRDGDKYLGNVQLTSITDETAEFHIFIGEKQYWGRGIGKKATSLILKYAFDKLRLKSVYLYVNQDNVPAIKAYLSCGFSKVAETDNEILMEIKQA